MEPIGMIQLVYYVTSMLVCVVLAAYFLRKFLSNEGLISLWWATGFSLLALGILAITVIALLGLHKIHVMLAFAFVAASVAFLYYAASLPFFDEKSFFREKFAVILFVVSFVLFLLLIYLSPEEHVAEIIGSPVMALFAVAFLVLAVLFNRVAVSFSQVVEFFAQRIKDRDREYVIRRLGALQSLVWIIAVWSLCSALFWGSVMAVGLVFVLSSFGFILLLYGCRHEKRKISIDILPPREPEKMPMVIQVLEKI